MHLLVSEPQNPSKTKPNLAPSTEQIYTHTHTHQASAHRRSTLLITACMFPYVDPY